MPISMDVDTALSEVPVNISALIDDTDFKTREESVTYDQAGMDLVWNFVTTAGAYTQTAVTPTTGDDHDWTNQGNGMYSIEIPTSGGDVNNDTEGFGWFTGFATGILPWVGPIITFRAAGINNILIDSAYNTTQGLAGTDLDSAISTAQADLDTITGTDGTTLATAQGNYAPSKAGDLMGLANDAITSAKYDESTAFPLTAVNGSTLTEAGGDGDHLTAINLPNQTMDITGNITGNLSGSVGSVTAQVSADMTAVSGDATAADNLEATYDGTGYSDDNAPATQAQVGNLTSGSAAINTVAIDAPNGFVLTTGLSEANDEDSTHELDGTTHDLEDDAGNTDAYYIFSVGGNGVPISITWQGYANSNGDSYAIYAYKWTGTPAWEQIGTINGASGSTIVTETFDLTNSHVGSGANLGKVHFRYASADGTKFATDRIICSYAVVATSVGYANGAIWVDTNNGVAGTESFVNGTADNPVLTWADALTIAGNVGLSKFELVNGSSIALTANSDNYYIRGNGSLLALGGQSLASTIVERCNISGIGLGFATYIQCRVSTVSLQGCSINESVLAGPITLTEAASYYFDACYSGIAGTATPALDFGAAIGNTNLNFRHYSGGIELENMGATGTDTMSLEGDGQLVLNANCDPSNSPVIAIRGNFPITDNVVGGFVFGGGTISDDARYDVGQIDDTIDANASIIAVLADTNELQTDWTDGGRLDLILDDVPTTAEFEARTITAADYLVEGDTLARVTLVDTVTDNTDLVTAAAVKTAMEADGGDLSSLMEALVNKLLIDETTGTASVHNDAGTLQGTVSAAFTSVANVTKRERIFIAAP